MSESTNLHHVARFRENLCRDGREILPEKVKAKYNGYSVLCR